jgi:cytochrome c-type biogenesis protein CcmH
MSGWIVFAALALASGLLLWRTGFPLRLWTVPATALMLGAAGYAWQGSPGLAGQPVAGVRQGGESDPALINLRDTMFGRFGFNAQYFAAADAMTRAGSSGSAATVMLGGVRKSPRDAALWTWLGLTLAENDGNQVSPASDFAFRRAEALGPEHPGPRFFHGLALVRQGEFEKARPFWARAVELTPQKASYRPELIVRLFLLDRFLAAREAQARARPTGPDAPPPVR